MCMYIYIYTYVYIHMHTHTHCNRLCLKHRRGGEIISEVASDANPAKVRLADARIDSAPGATVSFHNFKSQNFKLSVSNPKNKYVACVSVLSRISNCQGLGCKNKHEILKTDRTVRQSSASVADVNPKP